MALLADVESLAMAFWLEFGGAWVLIRLVSTFAGTLYFYLFQHQSPAHRSARGFLHFCLPPALFRSGCVRIDIANMVLRELAGLWLLVTVGGVVAVLAPLVHGGLEGMLGPRAAVEQPSLWLLLPCAMAAMLVHDLTDYAVHLASHRWGWLWAFHAMHHSTEFLTPMSSKRSHPLDDLIQALASGLTLGLAVGGLAYATALPAEAVAGWGLVAYALCHLLNLNALQHSHVGLSFGQLEGVLISPAQHQLHHDRARIAVNLGSRLAIWDRLFGTFERSQPPGSFTVGLPPDMQPEYNSLLKLYLQPFRRLRRMLQGWRADGRGPRSSEGIRCPSCCGPTSRGRSGTDDTWRARVAGQMGDRACPRLVGRTAA
jgi:sterol desaturase/sphingolipid hydroxylase (fatty acid hydroxylase superfamily)